MKTFRRINEELTSFFDKHYSYSTKPITLIYEAPTGYGKTSIAPVHGYYAYSSGISYGHIHILPMRSMVYKLYTDYITSKKSILENLYSQNLIEDQGICYQTSGLTISGKNPFLSCLVNFVTFDSYFLNLVRIGIGERNIFTRHYETSRAMIFTSTITYDEVHLYGGDPGSPENIMYTSFKASLETSLYNRTPLNILSATLPSKLGETLYDLIKTYEKSLDTCVVWVKYGRYPIIGEQCDSKITISKNDPDYDSQINSVKWITKLFKVKRNGLDIAVRDIRENYYEGKRILVVVNKPERAVNMYKNLEDLEPHLIHGRLKQKEREERERVVDQAKLLIATQVVEAGIDVDYDTLYTDIAPPSNLIQRAGRINRRLENKTGEINILVDQDAYNGVYEENIVFRTIEFLNSNSELINWRKPYCEDNCIGYGDLLDNIYMNYDFELSEDHDTMLDYIFLSQLPYVKKRDILNVLVKTCVEEKGIARSSLLIPLIHTEKSEIKEKNISEANLYRNVIPSSLSWILRKTNELFGEEVEAVVYKKCGKTIDEYYLEITKIADADPLFLKQKICNYLAGREEGLLIGLLVREDSYKEGLGLLV